MSTAPRGLERVVDLVLDLLALAGLVGVFDGGVADGVAGLVARQVAGLLLDLVEVGGGVAAGGLVVEPGTGVGGHGVTSRRLPCPEGRPANGRRRSRWRRRNGRGPGWPSRPGSARRRRCSARRRRRRRRGGRGRSRGCGRRGGPWSPGSPPGTRRSPRRPCSGGR